MSQRTLQSIPVVEWSPSGGVAFDPATKQIHRGQILSFSSELSSREVILTIARRSAFIRAVRMPDAPRPEIAQILGMQIGQYFPVPGGDLAYDFRMTEDKNEEGRLVVVGAVRTDLLRIALAELKAAGLRPKLIVPAAFGSWLLAQSLGKDTCAVVESTAEGLAVDIIADGELRYSRVAAPASSESDIEAEVGRTFSVAGVAGGDIIAAAGLKFAAATANTAASTTESFAAPGAEQLGMTIELPEIRIERENRRNAQHVRLVAFLVVAAIGMWAFIYLDRADSAKDSETVKKNWARQVKEAKDDAARAQSLVSQQESIAEALKLGFAPAQRFSDVLLVAGNMAPGSVWLTGITLERGRPITLRGTAVDSQAIAAYQQRLTNEPRFRDVKLVFANNAEIENKPIVQFSMSAHALGNFPLYETKGVAKK